MLHVVIRSLALLLILLFATPATAQSVSSPLSRWILDSMIRAQPEAPWRDTYPQTAEIFAKVATDSPLFSGEDGPRKTAAWLVSTAWFEGRFDPKAKGDGRCLDSEPVTVAQLEAAINSPPGTPMRPKLRCKKKGPPQSFCMFQVGKSNFEFLKTSEEEIMGSVEVCTRHAVTMMKSSISLCRSHPQDEWLAQYASGGGECGGKVLPNGEKAGLLESRHRVNKAKWLFTNVKAKE